jgi:hypothetical protein
MNNYKIAPGAEGTIVSWLFIGEVGESSKAIAQALIRPDISFEKSPPHPHDRGDFRRCEKLLSLHPFIREAFQILMPSTSVTWKHLVSVWDAIAYLDANGKKDLAVKLLDESLALSFIDEKNMKKKL